MLLHDFGSGLSAGQVSKRLRRTSLPQTDWTSDGLTRHQQRSTLKGLESNRMSFIEKRWRQSQAQQAGPCLHVFTAAHRQAGLYQQRCWDNPIDSQRSI